MATTCNGGRKSKVAGKATTKTIPRLLARSALWEPGRDVVQGWERVGQTDCSVAHGREPPSCFRSRSAGNRLAAVSGSPTVTANCLSAAVVTMGPGPAPMTTAERPGMTRHAQPPHSAGGSR